MSSSPAQKKTYLLTGGPGTGKTTIIKEVISKVRRSAGGFYTEEIRNQGTRQGFKIISLDGRSAIMAHVKTSSPYRVGKYGVDIGTIDEVAVPALKEALQNCDIVVIDEIGKMELLSTSFRDAVIEALESDRKTLGSIMLASHPWADRIRQCHGVEIVAVTRFNRSEVVALLLDWLES